MRNLIYLRTKRKLIVQPSQHQHDYQLPHKYIATALKNIEYLGFTFSKELIEVVQMMSVDEFVTFYNELVADLKQLVGANVNFKPMYPNFPQQVMMISQAELYLNAIIHYVTLRLPAYEALDRFPLLDQVDLDVLDLGTGEDFNQYVRNLIQANGSISQSDKETIEEVIATYADVSAVLPETIPSKENVGFVVATLLKYDKATNNNIRPYITTATDVLRLAVAWSGGDVSLATNTKFRKFKRSERRLLLELLEQCGNKVEDMLRYKHRWIRLGEIVHPAEYKHNFFGCKEAFDILRNDKPYATFSSKVEQALVRKDTALAADLLASRPGEFARRLDHLLRMSEQCTAVIASFSKVAVDVSTPVLLQIMTHFSHRNDSKELRTFFLKGNIAKVFAIDNTLPTIASDVCEAVVQVCKDTLVDRFTGLPALGDVYVDERLKQYVVPFSQRSASKALRTIVRGSRLEMPKGNTHRFFLWWKEGVVDDQHTGRVDIDLSAVMYDENWNYVEHISYTHLRSDQYKAAHSGDVTSAPYGACEFIDIHIPSVVQYGGRYVVASLNAFTNQPYCKLPECFAGWMMRQHPDSGEIFEPSTVIDRIDLAADSTIAIPVILDLVERKVIWCDLALKQHPQYVNNIHSNGQSVALMGKAMATLTKPTLYDLFTLHVAARGRHVDDAADAQTVFSVNDGITPFDIDTIMAEFVI